MNFYDRFYPNGDPKPVKVVRRETRRERAAAARIRRWHMRHPDAPGLRPPRPYTRKSYVEQAR